MRLVWLRLCGFRRFADAEVQLDGKLVALVGPNEAGKSSILAALRTLDTTGIAPGDLTHGSSPPPNFVVLRGRFLLDPTDRSALGSLQGASTARWFVIEKLADGSIERSIDPPLPIDQSPRKRASRAVESLLATKWARSLDKSDAEGAPAALDALREALLGGGVLDSARREAISKATASLETLSETAPRSAANLRSALQALLASEPVSDPNHEACDILWERRPLFREFGRADRALESEYDLTALDLSNVPAALANLCRLAGLDLPQVIRQYQDRMVAAAERPIEEANERLDRFFAESWKQSGVSVRLRPLETRVELIITTPSGPYTSLRERSDGLKAFVALTTFASLQESGRDLVLLVDEAETHLHYDAQADLIRVFALQQAARKIVYTTHSAGCLPENLGSAVRVVAAAEDRTSSVRNSFWTEGPGFSPLLLGMGASALIFASVREAVVAEGAVDLVLLPTLLGEALPRETLGYQVTPGLAEVSPTAIGELELQAARLVYVVDGDDGGKAHAKKLLRAGVDESRIVVLGDGIEAGLAVISRHVVDSVEG